MLFYYQSEDPLNNTVVPQLHIFLLNVDELVIYWPSTVFVNLFTVITILFYREGRLLYPNVFNFYWTQWKLLAFNEMAHWDIPFTYRQSAKGTERKKWTYHLWLAKIVEKEKNDGRETGQILSQFPSTVIVSQYIMHEYFILPMYVSL